MKPALPITEPKKMDHLARLRPGNRILRVIEAIRREKEEAERA